MMNNKFSKNLRTLRIDNDLKQSIIAKLLNISQGAYAKYESGQREPSFDTLLKISELFNVSIDDLLNSSLTTKINNVLNSSIDYEVPSDIANSLDLIKQLKEKREYYVKERKRLEVLLNTHIPNRIAEIDDLLGILNKSTQKSTYDNNFNEEYSSEILPDISKLMNKEEDE